MTQDLISEEQFTGLILLTGLDKPGIAAATFETLSPFAISILDIDQIVISHRLILTVLIQLNPAHQTAIESDLNELAQTLGVDIACLFSKASLPKDPEGPVELLLKSTKLHPKNLALLTSKISEAGGNILGFSRFKASPLELGLTITSISKIALSEIVASCEFEEPFSVVVQ